MSKYDQLRAMREGRPWEPETTKVRSSTSSVRSAEARQPSIPTVEVPSKGTGIIPEVSTSFGVKSAEKGRFDREKYQREYMREYMRKRRGTKRPRV